MNTETIIYIILAGVAALLLALFQYIYGYKQRKKLNKTLALLRFLSLFAILILLINPKFNAVTYYEEKPSLIIAVDNSESIAYLNQDESTKRLVSSLMENQDLKDRFNIDVFKFGSEFKSLDSLNFKDKQTNAFEAFQQVEDIYPDNTTSIIFISDGNQTFGKDYQYVNNKNDAQINTVILGDTTTYLDLSIKQVNVNRYVYLKNRFPVEIVVNYSGTAPVSSRLEVLSGSSSIYSQNIQFNADKTSEIISTTLPANRVGVQSYRVSITPLSEERNTVNNIKNFAVEVIDQKTNIALVSEQLHPDLGALKKAIETNEQRSVSVLNPSEINSKINDFQLFIIYQPNNSFNNVLKELFEEKRNTLVITGPTTDWNLLNSVQSFYEQEVTNQTEDYQAEFNVNYSPFIVDDLNFEDFPPMVSEFGELQFKVQQETLLYKTVNGINTNQPLLSTFEIDNQKHAILNGEGIWRWRAHSFLQQGTFNDFDNIIGKLVQYLSSNKKRSRMTLDYRSFYNGNENLIINAQYFNNNFEFDPNANLLINLENKEDQSTQELPLLLKGSTYSVDLSGIASGEYSFTVRNTDEPISASGEFKVLEYNVEQQFLNANVTKMQALSANNGGSSYFIDNTSRLIPNLLEDQRFATIQKQKTDVVQLIDWKYLLGFIVLTLSLEWFIRKYNGLI
ncbi:vWA domain-containing protein [Winogradskyella sp. A3E31]|uniref:vWA domain-containing protein n=1 Tax=Winogradskyella sp. A3E31 TaxID=3349637 RepID=UPI00398A8172